MKSAFFKHILLSISLNCALVLCAPAEVPLDQCARIKEQPGQEAHSPFYGMILLKSGILKNIRLHGRYGSDATQINKGFPPHPAFTLKNNVPLDPIAALAQHLFPSVDGAILTHNERKNDFWGYVARHKKEGMEFINGLLNIALSQDTGKLEEIHNHLETFKKTNMKGEEDKIKAHAFQGAENVLIEALNYQGDAYPPHIAIHLLLAFACRFADTVEDLKPLTCVMTIDQEMPLFTEEVYDATVKAFVQKVNPTLEKEDLIGIGDDKTDPKQEKDNPTPERIAQWKEQFSAPTVRNIFLFTQGYFTYKPSIPPLIGYQSTTYTPDQGDTTPYPDCGETSL